MSDSLRFSVHRGDGAALLAFDVDEKLAPDLAGFAVECAPPVGDPYMLLNRLSFEQEVTSKTTPSEREWTPTDEAPIQKFHWIHFPKDVPPGKFTYKAKAMLFADGEETKLKAGPTAEFSLELRDEGYRKMDVGFTRGYMSSQAYAERFENADFKPDPWTAVYDTSKYAEQYRWLGAHARKLAFEILDETVADPELSLDVFAYDLDESDVVYRLAALGKRLRLYLDDSDIKKDGGGAARKAEALAVIEAGGGTVERGHFHRFAHDKILIQKRGETPTKVLSGSANFSVRGLYVQANNVFVFDDEATAKVYEEAFEQAWTDAKGFAAGAIAAEWLLEPAPKGSKDLPGFQVSFAPHADPEVSLAPVAEAIKAAKSSVLFAIMDVGGSGPVLEAVRDLPERSTDLYAFGTTQRADGSLEVKSPSHPEPTFIPFGYLHSKVPEPFRPEISGGGGIVIHHKFVVVDFNGDDPVVFAGSSNLAGGGEHENGDNLLAFRDAKIASTYAVEAIRLIDHYRFRAAMKGATKEEPLRLSPRSANWAAPYFDPKSPKHLERKLFAKSAT
jgi:phosphatidylserine/phosphatidylglycerophosphate/cardiolipin synthase-like enzyme